MSGKVVSINISDKKGVVKKPVGKCEVIEDFGLFNDAHAGKGIRQVSLLAEESVEKMRQRGVENLTYGVFAENITTSGIELHTLAIGTILNIGSTVHEVTKIGKECHGGCEIKQLTGYCIMPTEGIFTKVLTGGTIKDGDEITIK